MQRINELHPSYLPLQYPLLFPYGEDGYRRDIMLSGKNGKRTTITLREYFCFRLQQRDDEAMTILLSRKLLQQFLVDAWTMVEAERLSFIRYNQKSLKADLYKGLTEVVLRGEADPISHGKRIILPSSFVGGPRYILSTIFTYLSCICLYTFLKIY